MYDILITVAEKDYNKLPFVINSIQNNIQGFHNIHVVSPTIIPLNKPDGIKYHLDSEVVKFDFSKFKGNIALRKGWYIQQFIKLFQRWTMNDYLVVDSDVILNKPLDIIQNGKPCFFLGEDQNHQPYFDFTKKVFGYGREYPYSFINEIMYFKRDLIQEMVSPWSFEGFFEVAVNALNEINHPTSSFSEYETYGNFIMKKHPEMYQIVKLKTKSVAVKRQWTNEEIKEQIQVFKKSNYDKISLHSWM